MQNMDQTQFGYPDYSYLAMAVATARSTGCRCARPAASARRSNQGVATAAGNLTRRIGGPRQSALDLPLRSGAWAPDTDAGPGKPARTRIGSHPRGVLCAA